jgi:hypothetical protein
MLAARDALKIFRPISVPVRLAAGPADETRGKLLQVQAMCQCELDWRHFPKLTGRVNSPWNIDARLVCAVSEP